MKTIKLTLTKNQPIVDNILAVLLSVALGNVFLQFLLRFLLTDWLRMVWVSTFVYLVLFPLNHWLVRKVKKQFPTKKLDRFVLIGLSATISGIFYLRFPIKITGSLLVLESAPLWVYRLSRLGNILSFFLAAAFAFFLLWVSLHQKCAKRQTCWFTATAFFTLLMIIGLLVYPDYGISSDEPNERTSGLVSAHYMAGYIEEELLEPDPYIPRLSTYRYRYYGVAYQLPLALVENNTLTRGQDIWLLRHLSNFLAFYLGVVGFYHLTAEFFGNPRYGLLGAAFLVLTPRLFAHAFVNTKDTVFMAAFTLALYGCSRFWERKSYWSAFLAGLVCAVAVNIRVIALALPLLTLGILGLDLASKRRKPAWKQTLIYLGVVFVFIVILWPAAWETPFATLGRAISLFSDYTYWNFRVMYLGEFMLGSQAPWHYLPVWMGITIPLSFILFFLIGLVANGIYLIRNGKKLLNEHRTRMRLIFLGIILGPPLLAILLNSTLYNGWRHFQFIYPSFLIIALLGFQWVISGTNLSVLKSPKTIALFLLIGMSAISLLLTSAWMVRHHPYQAVYFNRIGYLIGRENFERDYWRIAVKIGLETLLIRDSAENLTICMESQFKDPEFLMIMTEEERARMDIITDPVYFNVCDYAVNTYRNPEPMPCERVFYEIEVDDLPILTITACYQD
jgi:hypothetical protein